MRKPLDLRALREPRTQQEIADRCGVTQAAVCHWETGGVPKRQQWATVARAYGVSLSRLVAHFLDATHDTSVGRTRSRSNTNRAS